MLSEEGRDFERTFVLLVNSVLSNAHTCLIEGWNLQLESQRSCRTWLMPFALMDTFFLPFRHPIPLFRRSRWSFEASYTFLVLCSRHLNKSIVILDSTLSLGAWRPIVLFTSSFLTWLIRCLCSFRGPWSRFRLTFYLYHLQMSFNKPQTGFFCNFDGQ